MLLNSWKVISLVATYNTTIERSFNNFGTSGATSFNAIKAERRRMQSKITGGFKTTSYEERMMLSPERIPGTCEWFQRHEKFERWLKEPRGLLLVSADPGCGKSVVTATGSNILPAEQPEATVCYFFFRHPRATRLRFYRLFSITWTVLRTWCGC